MKKENTDEKASHRETQKWIKITNHLEIDIKSINEKNFHEKGKYP